MVDLCDLGLSSYEERAYMALLELGTGSAPEIASKADIPEGRIYDTLNELEAREAVYKDSNQRPQVYRPVDPSTVIDGLVESRRQELEAERSRINQVAAELRNNLGQLSPMDGRFWATRTRESELEFVQDQIERFSDASDEVLIVGDEVLIEQFLGAKDTVWQWLESLDDSSPSIRILLSEEAAGEQDRLWGTLRRDDSTDISLEIRMNSAVTANFDLIDQSELYLYVTDPFTRSQPIGTIRVNEADIVTELKQEFMTHWESGTMLSHHNS